MNYKRWSKYKFVINPTKKQYREYYKHIYIEKCKLQYDICWSFRDLIDEAKANNDYIMGCVYSKKLNRAQNTLSKMLNSLLKNDVLTKKEFKDWRYRWGFK